MQSLASILQDYIIDYEKRPWFRGKLPKTPTSPIEGRGKITPGAAVILSLSASIFLVASSPLVSAAPVDVTIYRTSPTDTTVLRTETPAKTYTSIGDFKNIIKAQNWDWIKDVNASSVLTSNGVIYNTSMSSVITDTTGAYCEQPATGGWNQSAIDDCIPPPLLDQNGNPTPYQYNLDVNPMGWRYRVIFQPTGKLKLLDVTYSTTTNQSNPIVNNLKSNAVSCTADCYEITILPKFDFPSYLDVGAVKKNDRPASVSVTKHTYNSTTPKRFLGGTHWSGKWSMQPMSSYTYLSGYWADYNSVEAATNVSVDSSYTAETDYDSAIPNGSAKPCGSYDIACHLGNLWDGVADTMLAVGKTITDFMSNIFVPDTDEISKDFDTLGNQVVHKLGFIYWAFDSIRDLGVAVSGAGTGGTCNTSACVRNFGTIFGSSLTVDFATLYRINSTAFTYLRWMLTGLATLSLIYAFHSKYEEFMEGR